MALEPVGPALGFVDEVQPIAVFALLPVNPFEVGVAGPGQQVGIDGLADQLGDDFLGRFSTAGSLSGATIALTPI